MTQEAGRKLQACPFCYARESASGRRTTALSFVRTLGLPPCAGNAASLWFTVYVVYDLLTCGLRTGARDLLGFSSSCQAPLLFASYAARIASQLSGGAMACSVVPSCDSWLSVQTRWEQQGESWACLAPTLDLSRRAAPNACTKAQVKSWL